jgi:WD40 repeat protein
MRILKGHEAGKPVHGLAFSPDGTRLASCGGDDTVRLWEVGTATSQVLARADSHFVAFSPAGDRLMHGQGSQALSVIDLASGARVDVSLSLATCYPHALFNHAGTGLVAVSGQVFLHDSGSGKLRKRWPGSEQAFGGLALGPGGTRLVTAHVIPRPGAWSGRLYDYPVRLWRYPAGRVLREFSDASNQVRALALSPDGRWLAATSWATLWVWEAATGAVALRHMPDTKHFTSLAFSPDGRCLAAAHNDRMVRLYAVPGWQEREMFDWKVGPIVSVCFAPDGMRAAAGGKRGRIVVWDIDP